MATSVASPKKFRFADFVVDFRSGEIRKHGVRLRLQGQPFQVLQILLERAGEIVTRDELRHALWPGDTFVDFDDGLNTAIKKIRDAFGDTPDHPRFIETIPRRGYRFLAPVESYSPEASRSADAAPIQLLTDSAPHASAAWWRSARPPRYFAVALLVLTAIVVGANARLWRVPPGGSAAASRIESLAVLPLTNLSHDPEQDYFADGMTEALITDLAQVKALRVISRTSVMHYKSTNKTLPEIARDLNVDAVIEGAVQRSGNRVRVTAQLIQGKTDTHLWARTYERDSQDVLVMQSDLAQAIVGEIQVRLTPQEREHLASARPVNPDAYNAYLLGNFHSGKRNPTAIDKGIAYFREAIRIAPDYAQAYAGLANAYFEREIWSGVGINNSTSEIRAATLKALELDGDLAEGHALLARIHFQSDWDWQRTEAEYQRALELNPNLASTYTGYAYFLQAMGRHQDAIDAAHRAVELDPLSPWNICVEGRILYRARQYENAIVKYQRALELDPAYPPALGRLADAYEQLGQYDQSLAYAAKFDQAAGDSRLALQRLARIYARAGKRREAMDLLKKIRTDSAANRNDYPLASVYASLGDHDNAIAELEKGVKLHSIMPYEFVDPGLDSLRSDPRFQQLLRSVKLPS